jgi:fermentation-respiration switch protein FrsA (DUF1100 family)
MFCENWLVFHPYSPADFWQDPPNARVENVSLHSTSGVIHAWWCPTADWTPSEGALIYCGGNAGNLAMRSPAITQFVRDLKTSVLIFDYPGYGRSEGSPSEAGCYAAAQAAYDWLITTKQIPANQILIYGASLGGGVATDLASKQPHRALILLMTFTSLPQTAQWHYPWLPARWLVRNRFDSEAKIGKCTGPVFIAHGTADRIVPYYLGERLFQAANEPKHFLRIEGGEHDETLPRLLLTELEKFLTDGK